VTVVDGTNTAKVAVELSVVLSRLRSRLRDEAGTRRTGMTISQLAVLDRVLNRGPITAASIASAEHVSQQAITQSLVTLKEKGLIHSERDQRDRRKMLIVATERGRRLFESLNESREAWLVRAIETVIAPEERASLTKAIHLLERLADADLGPDVVIR
jgi:DNA-binding MarR family transcriptional regulator